VNSSQARPRFVPQLAVIAPWREWNIVSREDAIEYAAKHHVHAQYYLIRNDATGHWFKERLAAG